MTDDLITRLRRALDEMEPHHRSLLEEAQRVRVALKEPKDLGRYHPGWTAWPDVEKATLRLLRLIDRDRALLAAYDAAEAAWSDPTTQLAESIGVARNHRRLVLRDEVKRAATFWLDPTPEETA